MAKQAQESTLTNEEISRLTAEFYAKGGKTTVLAPLGFPRHVRRGFGATVLEGDRK